MNSFELRYLGFSNSNFFAGDHFQFDSIVRFVQEIRVLYSQTSICDFLIVDDKIGGWDEPPRFSTLQDIRSFFSQCVTSNSRRKSLTLFEFPDVWRCYTIIAKIHPSASKWLVSMFVKNTKGYFTHEPRATTMKLWERKESVQRPSQHTFKIMCCGHRPSSVMWSHMWPGPQPNATSMNFYSCGSSCMIK